MVCRAARTSWITVQPVMFVYMFASFLSYPTFQQLIYSSVCSMTPNCSTVDTGTTNNGSSCDNASNPVENAVRSEVSRWILYSNLAMSIPAILASLFYGSLSDLFGRKLFIIVPAFGGMLNTFLIIVVSYTVPDKVYLFLIGFFILGLTGGYTVFNFSVYSYVADISTTDHRTVKLSILESMTYFGATISSFISGIWIQQEGYIPPYWGIFACFVAVILYTLFILPPTPSSIGRNNIQMMRSTNSVLSIDSFNANSRISILFKVLHNMKQFISLLLNSWRIAMLFCIIFIVEINFLGVTDIVILYSINRLCWSSQWIGYFLGSKVFFNAIAALVFLPFITTFLKVSDTAIVFFGLVSSIGALVTMGTATQTWMMFLAPVIGSMRGCVIPVVRSMLSKLTPPGHQGIMFSGVGIIEACSQLIASLMYNGLFPITYSISPGFCFYLMILILLLPMSCALVLHLKPQQQSETCDTDSKETQPLIS